MGRKMRRLTPLTQARLKEVLLYDPLSGIFTRLAPIAGKPTVGYAHPYSKHRVISLDGHNYPASHLAFLYMTGALPVDQVDHIDVDPTNDRWANLRQCNEGENRRNTRAYRNNTSGFKGVSKIRGRWRAQISSGYRSIHLGVFDTAEAASAAYASKAEELFGEFARAA